MSEKTALFFATVDGFDDDKLYKLSQDIEKVGKKFGIPIWLDAVIEGSGPE
jgi:hypothetical protein